MTGAALFAAGMFIGAVLVILLALLHAIPPEDGE